MPGYNAGVHDSPVCQYGNLTQIEFLSGNGESPFIQTIRIIEPETNGDNAACLLRRHSIIVVLVIRPHNKHQLYDK